MTLFDELDAVERDAETIIPRIVLQHRDAGILTWALLHKIEAETFAALAATGSHAADAINMLRSSGLMQYPTDEREVSFKGHEVLPTIFSMVEKEWLRVH
jgi:hypothetical protein